MRMNGLDPDKISTIWVEFRETLEQYRDRVMTEEAGFSSEAVTTRQLEDRLVELKDSIFPERLEVEEGEEKIETPKEVVTTPLIRKSIEELLEEKDSAEDSYESYEVYESYEDEPELELE